MTGSINYNRFSGTSDPRIPTGREENVSTYEEFPQTDWQESITEQVETLTNQTGQLRSEVYEHPQKYNVQIFDTGDPDYQLTAPILILIESYILNDAYIASFPELEIFGEGVTESEAIINLKYSLLDLYDELHDCDKSELGDLPRTWLRILDRLINKENL